MAVWLNLAAVLAVAVANVLLEPTVADSRPYFVCEPGWVEGGDFCYKYSHKGRTWIDAYHHCHSMKAEMARPVSEEHNAHMRRFAPGVLWLSGRHMHGVWRWVDDDSLMCEGHQAWMPAPPDSSDGKTCAVYTPKGFWKTTKCDELYGTLCMKEHTYSSPHRSKRAIIQKEERAKRMAEGKFDQCYGGDKTGHCYILFEEPKSWHEAKRVCSNYGGYLAEVRTKTEGKVVERAREIVQKLNEGTSRDKRAGDGVWMGGQYSGHWAWVASGTDISTKRKPSVFQQWKDGQPAPVDHASDDVSDLCVAAESYAQHGHWNVLGCDVMLPFVCQRPMHLVAAERAKKKKKRSERIAKRKVKRQTKEVKEKEKGKEKGTKEAKEKKKGKEKGTSEIDEGPAVTSGPWVADIEYDDGYDYFMEPDWLVNPDWPSCPKKDAMRYLDKPDEVDMFMDGPQPWEEEFVYEQPEQLLEPL